jgi:hypothetical protein
MPTITTQGEQRIVCFGQYKIIGENVPAHSQETILMLGIVASMVNFGWKYEHYYKMWV